MNKELKKLSKYIEINAPTITEFKKVYYKGNLPKKKIEVALKTIAPNVFEDKIEVYIDCSNFGKGDVGVILTTSSLFFREKNGESICVPFDKMSRVELTKDKLTIFYLNLHVDLPGTLFRISILEKVLVGIQERYKNLDNELIRLNADRILILEEMSQEFQINYLKALVIFEKETLGQFSEKSFAEILGIMNQLGFTRKMRENVKAFIFEDEVKLKVLLRQLIQSVPYGNLTNIKYSLLKDMIRMRRIHYNSSSRNNQYFNKLGKWLDIDNNLLEKLDLNVV